MRKQLILGVLCFAIGSSAFAATATEYGLIAGQIAVSTSAAMAIATGKAPALPPAPVAAAGGSKLAPPAPVVAPAAAKSSVPAK